MFNCRRHLHFQLFIDFLSQSIPEVDNDKGAGSKEQSQSDHPKYSMENGGDDSFGG